jgi:hypothetical protein
VFRKVMVAVVLVLIGAGCTPMQIATLQSLKGPIAPTDQATLLALPDAPIRDGEQVINLDGSLMVAPSREAVFWSAVAQTSWATRPDLHRWLHCVVNRESRLDPDVYNPRGADKSYGYMQINMRGSLGPARMAAFGLSSYSDLFNPVTNLEAGFELFQAAGTQPWASTRHGC